MLSKNAARAEHFPSLFRAALQIFVAVGAIDKNQIHGAAIGALVKGGGVRGEKGHPVERIGGREVICTRLPPSWSKLLITGWVYGVGGERGGGSRAVEPVE